MSSYGAMCPPPPVSNNTTSPPPPDTTTSPLPPDPTTGPALSSNYSITIPVVGIGILVLLTAVTIVIIWIKKKRCSSNSRCRSTCVTTIPKRETPCNSIHLVFMEGYCISAFSWDHRLSVDQFAPNKTLKFHLQVSLTLRWEMRMKIALGSAKGLAYLHEDCDPKIIHGDVKSENILLDDSFEAKVAYFGHARFNSETSLYTTAAGTKGYIDPEYALTGKLTAKSDVYSFGVVLLELITGRQPTGGSQNLVEWAKPLLTKALKDKKFDTLADPRLQRDYNSDEMARMVTCAAACVSHSAQHRPRMSMIVRDLEVNVSLAEHGANGDTVTNNPSAPGYCPSSGCYCPSSYSISFQDHM